MPNRALIEKRPWLLASLVLAIVYYFLRDSALGEIWLIPLKGSAVASLAIYSFQRHAGHDGWMIALVMALASLGDMAIEWSMAAGGAAFFASHLVAIALYLRNRRGILRMADKGMAVALLIGTPLVCWLLTRDAGVTFYGTALGAMAGSAWLSRFPHALVGLGAMLFIVSDWLIFAQVGAIGPNALSHAAIWPLYVFGQMMIATGVIRGLRGENN